MYSPDTNQLWIRTIQIQGVRPSYQEMGPYVFKQRSVKVSSA